MQYYIFSVLLAYFFGSISPSVLLGKYIYRRDLRAYGSNNPGTCNTVYVLGVKAGAIVLLVDAFKGIAPLWIVSQLFAPSVADPQFLLLLTAFSAVLGHCASIFLRLKGGKGFATFCGVTIFLFPKISIILFVIFTLTVLISKYITIGTFTVVILSPLVQVYNHYLDPTFTIKSLTVLFAISLLVIYRHRENVVKLIKGTEISIRTPRISNEELHG